jgi:AcrR family transcriptional regulator
MQQMMFNKHMSIQISRQVLRKHLLVQKDMLRGAMAQVLQFGDQEEAIDPRILRSRRMLVEALGKLLTQKRFDDISIQEIADEATLNRATFYLHYPDKNALLQAMTAARFGELIVRRGLSFTNCNGALRAIALGVCDYLAETPSCPGQLAKMPLEGSIIPVVEDMFRRGAADHATPAGADPELLGTTAAWAIFGAARRWYQTPDRIPAEEMAARIEAMVKPIFLSASAS